MYNTQKTNLNAYLRNSAFELLEDYYAQGYDLLKIISLCSDFISQEPIETTCNHLDILTALLIIKDSLDRANVEVDKEYGFLWFEIECANILQLCCSEDGKVDPFDHGGEWGICGDVNWQRYGSIELRNLAIEYAIDHKLQKDHFKD